MADEWVKVRIQIRQDPKVIAMAARLGASPDFREYATGKRDIGVTACVTEDVTVTALTRVWGVTRRDGLRHGDDVTLEFSDLSTIDRIAGYPGFGEAMAYVGWAVVEEGNRLRFPKLLPYITSADEKKREAAAERQRKRRERVQEVGVAERDKQRDVSRSCHAPVTPPSRLELEEEEEREKKEDLNGAAPAEALAPIRLSEFESSPECLAQEFASKFDGVINAAERDARQMAPKFRDLLQIATVDEVREEIHRKDRPRSEQIWKFEKRFEERHKVKGIPKPFDGLKKFASRHTAANGGLRDSV